MGTGAAGNRGRLESPAALAAGGEDWSLAPFADADPEEVAAVLSRSFHGSAALQSAWRDEIVQDLGRGMLSERDSVIACEGGAVVGVLLVASAGRDGARITAGGVLPAYRGRGIAGSMTGRVIERARDAGRRAVWLEVGLENRGAIRLWRRLGFETTRRLVDLRASRVTFRAPTRGGSPGQLRRVAVDDLLADFERLHAVEPFRGCQTDRLAALAGSLSAIEATDGGRRLAYLIHKGPRVEDLAVVSGQEDVVQWLLEAAFREEAVLHLTTWPEEDPLCLALQTWGFVRLASSLEMRLALPDPAPR